MNGQYYYENILNTTKHWGDANQNLTRYYPILPAVLIITKRRTIKSVGEEAGTLKPSFMDGVNAQGCRHFGKQVGGSSKG